jgi:hypothetical protein
VPFRCALLLIGLAIVVVVVTRHRRRRALPLTPGALPLARSIPGSPVPAPTARSSLPVAAPNLDVAVSSAVAIRSPDLVAQRRYQVRSPTSAGRWWLLEALALLVLLLLALMPRLHDLAGARGGAELLDEGIISEQLMLMAHGFRPFRDISTWQGLLLLDLLFPFYQLFGGTLGAARLGVGALSLVGIVGVWWSARQVSGAIGGLAAALLLVASLPFLEGSKLVLAEVPSLVPCIWAIGCAVRWHRRGSPSWLFLAVALATVGILIKPMAIAIIAPVALLALLRRRVRWQHLALAVLVAFGVTVAVAVVMGPADVYQQIVAYPVRARVAGVCEPRCNFREALFEPVHRQPGIYLLGLISAGFILWMNWRRGLALLSWPLATTLLLLVYHSIQPRHLVYLMPPLALLGGAGLGLAARLAWREAPTGRGARLLTVGVALLLAALPLGALPDPFNKAPSALADNDNEDTDAHIFDRPAVQSINLLTEPGSFILTDHPFLAAESRRLVPPSLVDPSGGRSRASVLTARDTIKAAADFDTRLALIWADRLRRLSPVRHWLNQNYQVVQAFGDRDVKNARGGQDRAIYLRNDSDFAVARARLLGSLETRESADFGGKLRLLGATVEPAVIGRRDQFTVTIGWEALSRISADHNVSINLVSLDGGNHRAEQESDLEGTVKPTPIWEPGHWFFHTLALQPRDETASGTYLVQIGVTEPKTRKRLKPVVSADNTVVQPDENGLLTIGTIDVR